MSKYSVIGSILLVSAFFLLCYQVITAYLEMDSSGEFIYKHIRIVNVLDEKYTNWIDNISLLPVQSIAEFIITIPLALISLFFSVLFLLIHTFKS